MVAFLLSFLRNVLRNLQCQAHSEGNILFVIPYQLELLQYFFIELMMLHFIDFLDECKPHHVANGNVSLITDAHHSVKVWKIKCNPGFTIFGADSIKCRKGIYSNKFPVCTSKYEMLKMTDMLYFLDIPNSIVMHSK